VTVEMQERRTDRVAGRVINRAWLNDGRCRDQWVIGSPRGDREVLGCRPDDEAPVGEVDAVVEPGGGADLKRRVCLKDREERVFGAANDADEIRWQALRQRGGPREGLVELEGLLGADGRRCRIPGAFLSPKPPAARFDSGARTLQLVDHGARTCPT
jgi:hypothetical protein